MNKKNFSCGILAILFLCCALRAKGDTSATANDVSHSRSAAKSACNAQIASSDTAVPATDACNSSDLSLSLSPSAGDVQIQTEVSGKSGSRGPTAFYSRPTGTRHPAGGTPITAEPTSPAPEPASLLLVGTGMLGFGIFLRRRRRTRAA